MVLDARDYLRATGESKYFSVARTGNDQIRAIYSASNRTLEAPDARKLLCSLQIDKYPTLICIVRRTLARKGFNDVENETKQLTVGVLI